MSEMMDLLLARTLEVICQLVLEHGPKEATYALHVGRIERFHAYPRALWSPSSWRT